MYMYFLLIRIAAIFGHSKARMLVQGQKQTLCTQLSAFRSCIWIHAASVGEFEQARPLIERLRRERPEQKIVVTFFSPSGYEMRKNYAHADSVLYLPFATRRNAKRFIEALQPEMAIFVKYEFWPAYLRELKKRGIPTYSISAIFREKQIYFRPWGKAMLRVLNCFSHIYVQDEASLALLQNHGIVQTSVAGDTRFDRVRDVMAGLQTDDARLAPVADFTAGCERVIVAGSTWPKDEDLLAEYMDCQAMTANESAKLILVPHEIDEAHLHFIFNRFKGRFVRYSSLVNLSQDTRRNIIRHANVLVIDKMGLLSSVYRFGQTAYIGGGFGVGIHNTIEAAVYGIPVLFGPNYLHFREAKGLIAMGAARSVRNYSELEEALETALTNYIEIGARAAEYVHSETGATEKIYNELFEN